MNAMGVTNCFPVVYNAYPIRRTHGYYYKPACKPVLGSLQKALMQKMNTLSNWVVNIYLYWSSHSSWEKLILQGMTVQSVHRFITDQSEKKKWWWNVRPWSSISYHLLTWLRNVGEGVKRWQESGYGTVFWVWQRQCIHKFIEAVISCTKLAQNQVS